MISALIGIAARAEDDKTGSGLLRVENFRQRLGLMKGNAVVGRYPAWERGYLSTYPLLTKSQSVSVLS